MNETFKVMTLFNCEDIEKYKAIYNEDPIWIQTVIGCRLLLVLKDMYQFNVTYIIPNMQSITVEDRALSIYPHANDSMDIYVKPMGFTCQLLEVSSPVGAIFTGRYGFILRRPNSYVLRRFYSLPFTRPVWTCLYLTILVVSGVFYYLSRWEKKILGGYSCYHYELLLAVGACCMHILPLHANMPSRRIAYASFILCVYVLNSFYSSNLLSHLVSDKDNSMDLQTLSNSNYEIAKLRDYTTSTQHLYAYKVQHNTNMRIIQDKVSCAKSTNIYDGLKAVMSNKTALLSDYYIVYPVLAKMFDTDDICQLIEIDLYSNIKKYFYTSNKFSYKNEFKVGVLRARETGVLQRILQGDMLPTINCARTYPMRAEFEQIVIPLSILMGSYVVAALIMLLERLHQRRYQVWAYVD